MASKIGLITSGYFAFLSATPATNLLVDLGTFVLVNNKRKDLNPSKVENPFPFKNDFAPPIKIK